MSANDGFEPIARRFDEASEARRIATADYQKAREDLSAMLIQMSASPPPAERAQ